MHSVNRVVIKKKTYIYRHNSKYSKKFIVYNANKIELNSL